MGTSLSKKDPAKDLQNNPLLQFTTPTGLYPSCSWDLKTIKRLVLSKKLAPLYPGKEEGQVTASDEKDGDYEECPICFLYYPGGLNRSNCCKKGICTECFFQIKKPNLPASCPFCNRIGFTVTFTGPLSREEKEKEAQEEQRVLELKIKIRNEEIERDLEREKEKKQRASLPPSPSDILRRQAELGNPNDSGIGQQALSLPASKPSRVTRQTDAINIAPAPPSFPSYNNTPLTDGEVDLDELLLNEAIRLSLMVSTSPVPALSEGSPTTIDHDVESREEHSSTTSTSSHSRQQTTLSTSPHFSSSVLELNRRNNEARQSQQEQQQQQHVQKTSPSPVRVNQSFADDNLQLQDCNEDEETEPFHIKQSNNKKKNRLSNDLEEEEEEEKESEEHYNDNNNNQDEEDMEQLELALALSLSSDRDEVK